MPLANGAGWPSSHAFPHAHAVQVETKAASPHMINDQARESPSLRSYRRFKQAAFRSIDRVLAASPLASRKGSNTSTSSLNSNGTPGTPKRVRSPTHGTSSPLVQTAGITSECVTDSSTGETQRVRFRVAKTLRSGSTGSVVLARDGITGLEVAIKTVSTAANSSSGMDARSVERECELQRRVHDHPSIAKLLGSTANGSTHAMVIEFCPRGDVLDSIPPDIGLPVSTVFPMARDLASALAHMHARGVAHRDVKPENLCVASDNTVRLVDFGLAHDSAYRPESRRVGTTCYMAPETLLREARDVADLDLFAVDAWAFGITVFCMLTGRFPWQSASTQSYEFVHFARHGEPSQNQAKHWARMPPFFRTLVENLLCVAPEDRWTMKEVAFYLSSVDESIFACA